MYISRVGSSRFEQTTSLFGICKQSPSCLGDNRAGSIRCGHTLSKLGKYRKRKNVVPDALGRRPDHDITIRTMRAVPGNTRETVRDSYSHEQFLRSYYTTLRTELEHLRRKQHSRRLISNSSKHFCCAPRLGPEGCMYQCTKMSAIR